jgi:hypothetical protein
VGAVGLATATADEMLGDGSLPTEGLLSGAGAVRTWKFLGSRLREIE